MRRPFSTLYVVPIVVSMSSAFSCAATVPEDTETGRVSQALVGGLEQDYSWSGVGRLYYDGNACTASVIAPHVILTAAHCFKFRSDANQTDHGSFAYGSPDNTLTRKVLRFKSLSGALGKNDIAVAELDANVVEGDPEWTTLMNVVSDDWLPDTGSSAKAKFGDHPWVKLVGFGCDNPTWQMVQPAPTPKWDFVCPPNSFGTKRSLHADWNDFDKTALTLKSYDQIAAITAHGDSGGPILVGGSQNILAVSSGFSATYEIATGALVETVTTFGDVYGNRSWIMTTAASF